MQSKPIAIVIILAILAAVGVFFFYKDTSYASITTFSECRDAGFPVMESYPERCNTPDGRTFVNESQQVPPTATTTPVTATSTGASSTDIKIYNISTNQTITSPLTIEGEARLWYFEASFPVELVDANGKRLAIGPATAQGDWMTTSFVPFKITLTYPAPSTPTGTLIFRNDNPSGLPENEKSFRVPVRFSQNERTVQLYYYNSALDKDANGNIICSAKGLVPVSRTIPVTQTPLQDTLRVFLKGELTASEKASGITTEYPLPSVELKNAAISPTGVLTIDLFDPLQKTNGGACRASILKAQIEATAKQFPEVKTVQYTTPVFQP